MRIINTFLLDGMMILDLGALEQLRSLFEAFRKDCQVMHKNLESIDEMLQDSDTFVPQGHEDNQHIFPG
ncbi:hypothetical protein Y032_0031g2413 [Ancylostoma ceylanicum]|uniref:Uncharacterized protein n=1 Tax=Ancylostoma ceylanicum TaxID=53326 RepID=A0A016UR78_9BILA|nr:hypothetical protein Y032_0031g2413 [Ancylostoma ceylanicum]